MARRSPREEAKSTAGHGLFVPPMQDFEYLSQNLGQLARSELEDLAQELFLSLKQSDERLAYLRQDSTRQKTEAAVCSGAVPSRGSGSCIQPSSPRDAAHTQARNVHVQR
eukprot:TRINITY_DN94032_c0_g1_i1.p1 TRINITY_DN94032_c0_g1~~TRINITY_DN94032_c0_g1_i1.p1  ORF type:complete len:110 (+),score=11.54 TRINITY_DN94032_c0_g1_i1:448-777(+)